MDVGASTGGFTEYLLLRGAVKKGFAGKELNEHYARFTDVEACLDYLEK